MQEFKLCLEVQQSQFVGTEEKLLVVFSSGQIVFDRLDPKKFGDLEYIENLNLAPCFGLSKFKMVKFSVLDCQTRVLLYLRSGKKGFDKFAVVDLELEVLPKAIGNADGFESETTVTADFDGSRVFSVRLNKVWDLNFHFVQEYQTRFGTKNFKVKSQQVELDKKSKANPAALVFVYNRNMLLISHQDGTVAGYLTGDLQEIEKHRNLTLKQMFLFSPEIGSDFLDELILSWDHKYVIGKSNNAQILILELSSSLILKKKFQFEEYTHHFSLSLNGRFLCICGGFFDSIARIDLQDIDNISFGEKGFLSSLHQQANEYGKTEANLKNSFFEKMICYRHGSFQIYSQKMQDRMVRFKALQASIQDAKHQLAIQTRLTLLQSTSGDGNSSHSHGSISDGQGDSIQSDSSDNSHNLSQSDGEHL